jgi:hypothetical protein
MYETRASYNTTPKHDGLLIQKHEKRLRSQSITLHVCQNRSRNRISAFPSSLRPVPSFPMPQKGSVYI